VAEQQQIQALASPPDPQPLTATTSDRKYVASVSLNAVQLQQAHPHDVIRLQSHHIPQQQPLGTSQSMPSVEFPSTISEQAEIPIMQIKFPGPTKQSFFLSASQISVDAPNAFTQVLRDSQHKLKPGKTLKVPIQDHTAPVFTVIHAYLSGKAIIPLSAAHHTILGVEHSEAQAYELLVKDARFYQLKLLQRALEDCITSLARIQTVNIPQNPPVTVHTSAPPPPPFVLLDITRKGQSIDIKDLNHLSVTKLSGRRLRKTLPRVRALISGAAFKCVLTG